MKYEEPIMEMFVFMLDDVITGSLGDLEDDDAGGSGNSGNEGVEFPNMN